MAELSVSILSADLLFLYKKINQIFYSGAKRIHIDIMDGHFVDNLSFGPSFVSAIKRSKRNMLIECHMMVLDPIKWVEPFSKAGCSLFIFHLEIEGNKTVLIEKIKEKQMSVGIALNPETKTEEIFPFLNKIDYVLVMTVSPGFGEQKMIEKSLIKIQEIKEKNKEMAVGVDGGVLRNNVSKIKQSGANVITIGSFFWKIKNKSTLTHIINN